MSSMCGVDATAAESVAMKIRTPRFVQRIIHGGQNVATVNTKPRYRITLRLGEPSMLFDDPVSSHTGRAARLQVLGLMKRPLSHDEAFDCTEFCWNHFKRLFAAELPNPGNHAAPANDATAEGILDREVKRFWVSGGVLPARLAEARMRLPGDYAVMWRKGDARKDTEPLFTLEGQGPALAVGGNRYAVEQKFFDDNPALGKIPILADVELWDAQANNWVPAPANVAVYFQLVRPPTVTRSGAGTGAWTAVAGAEAQMPNVAPPLRADYPVRDFLMPPKAPKGRGGPAGYFDRYVTAYRNADSRKRDPQRDNAHWHLGGKRGMADRGRDLLTTKATAAGTRDNIFSTARVTRFHNQGPSVEPTEAAEAKHRYAVKVKTNANGLAGLIFAPSRVGGDRYQLRAYIETPSKTFEALTGVMTRWRTVRFCADLVMQTPADATELHPDLVNDFTRHGASCPHSTSLRYCEACVLRDGALKPIDYAQISAEFAKAWCEVLFEPRARTPITFADVDVQTDMARMVQTLNADIAKNFLKVHGSLVARGDGNRTTFNVNLPPNLQPGVTLKLPGGEIAVPPNGAIPAQAADNLTGGQLNHATGALQLTFSAAPGDSVEIAVAYTAAPGFELDRLLYFPTRSPFLVNFRSVEGYAGVQGANSAPMQCSRTAPPLTLTRVSDSHFTGTAPFTPLREPKVALNGTVLASGKYTVSADEVTGDAVVHLTEEVENELFAAGDGVQTLFAGPLAHPVAPKLRTGLPYYALVKVEDIGSDTVLTTTRTIGAVTSAGGVVRIDPNAGTLSVQLAAPLAVGKTIKVNYFTPQDCLATDVVTLVYTTSQADVAGAPSEPDNAFSVAVTNLVEDHLLMAMVRALDDNQGFMPGIVMIRGGIKSTWSLYRDLQDQGKGIANGVIVYGGNIYDNRTVNNLAVPATKAYTDILIHELGHSLYVNHFYTGSAAGPRNDLHDMYDVCLMGYGPSNFDLCGQCVAGYMGMNVHDIRFRTYDPNPMAPTLLAPADHSGSPVSG